MQRLNNERSCCLRMSTRNAAKLIVVASCISRPSSAFIVRHITPDLPSLNESKGLYMSRTGSKENMKYLRIQPRNVRGNRRVFELQTAVTTLSKILPNGEASTIDLHSQLHFGDDSYFDFYNDEKTFGSKYDNIFYELIVSNDMLQSKANGSKYLSPQPRALGKNQNPVSPTLADENTANSYGLSCQLNVIDYTKSNWIHCDTTREEYYSIISNSNSKLNDGANGIERIWALASTATAPLQEYTSALFRPLTPSTANSSGSSRISSRRLFSNLFLDGDALATFLRLLLWSFSPSPEVSILLLDWSSIQDPKPTGMISQIFIPVMEALLTGNIVEARRLVFAQLLVSGQTSGGRDKNLVRKRNSVAMHKMMDSLEIAEGVSNSDCEATVKRKHALLYGAMHCQDLQSRFQKMGYHVSNVEWRTAWSVSVPTLLGSGTESSPTFANGEHRVGGSSWGNFALIGDPNDIGIGLVLVPLYLVIGGLDWIGTIQDISQSIDGGSIVDAVAIGIFYIMRHLAMYLGLSKFVVEWDGEAKLFDGNDKVGKL